LVDAIPNCPQKGEGRDAFVYHGPLGLKRGSFGGPPLNLSRPMIGLRLSSSFGSPAGIERRGRSFGSPVALRPDLSISLPFSKGVMVGYRPLQTARSVGQTCKLHLLKVADYFSQINAFSGDHSSFDFLKISKSWMALGR
jgi:hypothetical protein